MTEALRDILWLVVVGFVLTTGVGLVATWIVRKISALVQWRVGPPFRQPFWDVLKLLGKEVLIPEDANKAVFIAAPLVGLAGVLLLSTMLLKIVIRPEQIFIGDIIVAIYLMVLPSLALILGASASASPHAQLGTAREMKMVMGYELPLVLALIVVVIKSGGQLSLAAIAENAHCLSISGMMAFLVSILCVQAKLGFVPFDIAEAETELASGVLMEYSGALLAVWKLMQAAMLVALPLFVVMVFMGGFDTGWSYAAGFAAGWWKALLLSTGKYVLIVVLLILIKNTNPRLRIDQAMRFFWFYCGIALAVAVVLAVVGNAVGIGWL